MVLGIKPTHLMSDTRAVIALRSRDEFGLSAAEIARQAGVNMSGVAKAIERAEKRYDHKYRANVSKCGDS
jgi:DNA-directed RNA polymerase specialized sigma24 family protein